MHPRIAIRPGAALLDAVPSIRVTGLRPAQTATISASTPRPGGLWSAQATFVADRAGTIDLARAAPVSRGYRGAAALGLLGIERLLGPGSSPIPRAGPVTTFRVRAGGATATARFSQLTRAPRVSESSETVARQGFVGRWYAPPGRRSGPGVLVWGGSEGGIADSERQAELLASHGTPALALAYFDEPGLPCSLSEIPLGYFVRALRWVRHRPGVDPSRVWILSGSRGTEAELLVAAHWPGLVHGIVAEAPSSIGYSASPGTCAPRRPAAWTLHGRAVAHAFSDGPSLEPDGAVDDRAGFEATLGTPVTEAAVIPIGSFRGPALLISGGDDQLWPARVYGDQIMRELRSDPAPHEHLDYPDAGHIVLGIPSIPSVRTERTDGMTFDLGGSPAADDAAHRADWPIMRRFIATH